MATANLLIAYILLCTMNRKWAGWILTLYSVTTTTLVHIYKVAALYEAPDLALLQPLMMQAMHLCHVGWDYTDGANPAKEKSPALRNLPSPLEYFAGALCPSQCIGGPFSHLADFLDYVYQRGDFVALPANTVVPAAKSLATGVAWAAAHLVLAKYFPSSLLTTEKFLSYSFPQRVRMHDHE